MSHRTMIRLVVALVIVVVGLILRLIRDRRAQGRPSAGATPGTTTGYATGAPAMSASTTTSTPNNGSTPNLGPTPTAGSTPNSGPTTTIGGDWFVREVRPVPRSQPPRVHLDQRTVAWFDGGNQQPTWVAPPSSVEIAYRPASTFGVNMPTVIITGPGHKGVRGRVTTDPRAPMGGFDKALEEQMAHELIGFLAVAQQLGVKVTGKGPIPTPQDTQGSRQTRLYGPPAVVDPQPREPGH